MRTAALTAFVLAAAAPAFAAPSAAKPAAHATPSSAGLEVIQPWSRPAAAGTNGVGYMVLANHGATPDALVKVETPIAAKVEMHASSMSGGVMTMHQVDKAPVPAGGETTFGPGAYHLMLIGLTKALQPGDKAPATLSFASGRTLKATFEVSNGLGPPAHH